jgi:hypothetical protein
MSVQNCHTNHRLNVQRFKRRVNTMKQEGAVGQASACLLLICKFTKINLQITKILKL